MDRGWKPTNSAIKVLFFARAREITQTNECVIPVENDAKVWEGTSDDFVTCLEAKFEALAQIRGGYTLAINHEYLNVDRDAMLTLRSGDEVALITPISGG
jgi:molybdopterin converting factor small subunit